VTDNLAVTPADYDEFCITAPVDSRLPASVSGKQLCGLYDLKPAKFGLVDNLVTRQSNYGDHTQVYNGFDATLNARFGKGGQFSGGLSTGKTVDNNCVTVDFPSRSGYCKTNPPWSALTQVKFMVIYPLPWSLQTSLIYQNFAGIDNSATYTATNAEILPTLKRNLGQCGTAATCNGSVTVDLTPIGGTYEPRIQQLDARFGRQFRFSGLRLRTNLDIANLFNVAGVLNLNKRYGPTYLDAVQIMGGRLMKVGVTLDF